MTTKRYQLLQGRIEGTPYIPPIPSEFDYYPDVIRDETLITDDPRYVAMGWLSEIGKASLIRLTNAQVDTLFDYMHSVVYPMWKQYVDNNRIGYKFGLVATVDFPGVLRNYDCSKLSYPVLVSIEDGIATINLESIQGVGAIAKYSRVRKEIYGITELKIASDGRLISKRYYYAYHCPVELRFIEIDKPAFY
jgi:hypothetical protein